MKTIKIICLVLLSLLLIVVGWSYLLGVNLERTVFNLSYYEDLLEQEEVDLDKIISGIIDEIEIDPEDDPEEIPDEEHEEVMIPEMDRLFKLIMTDALKDTIEASWVKEQILLVIEDILKLTKGEIETLSVVIELEDFQDDFMKNMKQRVKAISEEELIEFGVPEEEVEQIREMFIEEFTAMTQEVSETNGDGPQLPSEIDLGQLMETGEFSPEMEEALSKVQIFHTYFPALHYIAFAIIFLLSCLLAGLWGGLKWFGTSLLITGVTFLSGLFLSQELIMAPLLTEISEEMPFGFDAIKTSASYTVSKMRTAPLIFSGVGLILLVGALIIGKKS